MTNWHDFFQRQGTAPSWPYAVDYEKEYEIDTDVLVIGGGIAGCWAAISAARKGVRVALVEKGDTNVCQVDVFIPNPEKGSPPIILHPDECWYCGCCVIDCPNPGAISFNWQLQQRGSWKDKVTDKIMRDTV